MVTIDESAKYTYPYTTDENELVDIRSFQEPLHERAMADAKHEANQRRVSWRNLGASFDVIRAFDESIKVTFHGLDSYTEKNTNLELDPPDPTWKPSQLDRPLQILDSNGLQLQLRFDGGGGNALLRFSGPSLIARQALRTLNTASLTEKDDRDLNYVSAIPYSFSVLLNCLGNVGCNAIGIRYDTNWNADKDGLYIDLLSERPIDDVKVGFSAHVLSEVQDLVDGMEQKTIDPSPLHGPLSDFSKELFQLDSGDKLKKVAQKAKLLANRIE